MRNDTPAYIKEWPGYVVLPDALNFPQLIIWQDAVDTLSDMGIETWDIAAGNPRSAQHIVTALCQLVTEWHLEKLPERVSIESFPATPRVQSTLLVAWLSGLLADLFTGSEDTAEKKGE